MPDLPEFEQILGLAEELQAELPKSLLGVKAAGRRARKILVKIRNLCPVVRRELRDSVVYPVDEPPVIGPVHDEETNPVEPMEAVPPSKQQMQTKVPLGRCLDLSDD